jgi:hypothetical protein
VPAIVVLLAIAAAAWVVSIARMAGMDAGPGALRHRRPRIGAMLCRHCDGALCAAAKGQSDRAARPAVAAPGEDQRCRHPGSGRPYSGEGVTEARNVLEHRRVAALRQMQRLANERLAAPWPKGGAEQSVA